MWQIIGFDRGGLSYCFIIRTVNFGSQITDLHSEGQNAFQNPFEQIMALCYICSAFSDVLILFLESYIYFLAHYFFVFVF